jgi:hypothetical protein
MGTGTLLGDGHFVEGDPVVVSSEAGHFALAIGFVHSVGAATITVGLDRALAGVPQRLRRGHGNADAQADAASDTEQDFGGLWHRRTGPASAAAGAAAATEHHLAAMAAATLPMETTDRASRLQASRFRIDKDELTAGLGTVRANIFGLFTAHGDSKRRRLIVDRAGEGKGRVGVHLLSPPSDAERTRYSAAVQAGGGVCAADAGPDRGPGWGPALRRRAHPGRYAAPA